MELAFAAMIGIILGITGHKLSSDTADRTPDLWTAKEHQQMIRQCSQSCGGRRMESYDAGYGKCKCSQKK